MNMKKFISVLLTLCVLGNTASAAAAAGVNRANGYRITGLKVNGFTAPIGIDTAKPTFSFTVDANEYNKSLSAYKIQVYNGDKIVWDSGKTQSENPYDIVYDGEALLSKTRYSWNVQAWDETGTDLGVSENSEFTTGFLNAGDWSGSFITAETANSGGTFDSANWIWRREGAPFSGVPAQTMYFRRKINIQKQIKSAAMIFTADDKSEAFVNGGAVGSTGEWASGRRADVTDKLVSGDNILAFKATNTSSGYAGLLVKLNVTYSDNTKQTIVSDAGFLTSLSYKDGWNSLGFDDSAWKAPDQFEAYGASPWNKGVSVGSSGDRAAPIFRKKFTVAKQVESATAFVCAAGLYELKINGESPDGSVLNPANTDYNKTLLYTAHDVTGLIAQGENAVGVMLGNGFYNSIMPGWNWSSAPWRTAPKLLMNIVIKYSDGTEQIVATDGGFKATLEGPITENDIYYGETYDARREISDYSKASFDDGGWDWAAVTDAPKGRIKHQAMEPIMKSAPNDVEVTKNKNGSYIVKNSVVTAGWLGARFNQPSGCELTITYGEKLNQSGGVVTKEDGGRVTQRDRFICSGGDDYYEPKFSYKGYQYVQIDGAVNEIKSEDIKSYDIHNAVSETGSFNCSNELINTLHEIEVRTILNNFHGKATDTPYLEKNGWLGDANVALETFGYNFSVEGILKKMLGDMQDAQSENGSVPTLVPINNWGMENVPVWNSIFVFGPELMDDIYGTASYSEKQYDVMRKLAVLDINRCKSNGWLWDNNSIHSDWVSPMGGENLQYIESDPEGAVIYQTAYAYKLLQSMERLAVRLGKSGDAAEYKSAYTNILNAYNARFYKKDKGIYDSGTWDSNAASARTKYRQSANILPLAFGMVPEEYRRSVIDNLINDIKSKNYHLDTGMIGTKYILPVLCDIGYPDIAFRILTQESYPSWGFWAVNGATTAHEMWETTSRSLDHYFLGTYDEWLYKGIGGICDIKDGYSSFTFKPQLSNDLENADVTLDTVRGTLKSGFKRNSDGTVTLKLTVPFGAQARAVVPDSDMNYIKVNNAGLGENVPGLKRAEKSAEGVDLILGSGSYEITCRADAAKLYTLSLKEAVDGAHELAEYDYTESAWSEFVQSLNEAERTLESADNQLAVNLTLNKLFESVNKLKANQNASRAALRELLSTIEKSGISKNNVVKAQYELLAASIDSANDILSKAAKDGQVDAAYLVLSENFNAAQKARVGNLAKNKPVTVSSDVNNSDWSAAKLTDGSRTNKNASGEYCGWSSSSQLNENHEEWACIDLETPQSFNTVVIYPSTTESGVDSKCYGMPEDFNIKVSFDGTSWTTVYEKTGQPLAEYAPVKIFFDSVSVRYVKLTGTKLRQKKTDGDTYRMQLAEIELLNKIPDGITEIADKTYYYKDGEAVLKTFITENGKKYYFNYNGYMERSKWVTDENGGRYYMTADGSAATGSFTEISGKSYCFDSDGRLIASLWIEDESGRYYAGSDGALFKNSWKNIGGKDYFFDNSGKLAVSAVVDGYAVDKNGARVTNDYANIGGKTYLTDFTGLIIKSAAPVVFKGKTYILASDGAVIKGDKIISANGKKYFVGISGNVSRNTWVRLSGKEYFASESGALYVNCVKSVNKKLYAFDKIGARYKKTGFIKIGGRKYYLKKGVAAAKKKFTVLKKTYYAGADGVIVKNKIVTVKKKKYYFNKKGIMLKNVKKIKIGRKRYKINKSGVVTKI